MKNDLEQNEYVTGVKQGEVSADSSTQRQFWQKAFSRNIGLMSETELALLQKAKVAIPGMGGVGGVHLITLVRSGVGRFSIADFDEFGVENTNRQYGARVANYDKKKLDVMKSDALSINPHVDIQTFPQGVTEENLDSFLEDVDVVIDGFDFFEINMRRKLFARAREKGIFVITAGPIGFGCSMLIFHPEKGLSFDEYFNLSDADKPEDKYIKFAIGLTPQTDYLQYVDISKVSISGKYGPSLGLACQLCSSMASSEALRILLNRGDSKSAPYYFRFDPYLQVYHKKYLPWGNKNPLQRLRFTLAKKQFSKASSKLNFPVQPQVQTPQDTPSDEVIKYLVSMATWAPSGDNSQHWKFSWDGEVLTVVEDVTRSEFSYAANSEPMLIAYGAAIENISIAATQFGFTTDVTINSELPNGADIAKIRFKHTGASQDPLVDAITQRHTNRSLYQRRKVPAKIVNELIDCAKSDGVLLDWIDSPAEMKLFKGIAKTTDSIIWKTKSLHGDLSRWIRQDYRQHQDGLSYDSLNFDPIQKLFGPVLGNWRFASLLNTIGCTFLPVSHSQRWMKHSGAYCVLVVDHRSSEAFLNGGRALQRFWLHATSLGLSLQPMTSTVIFLNHLAEQQTDIFSKESIEQLEEVREVMQERYGKSRVPLFFFRVGYSKEFKARSPRRNVDEVLSINKP